MAARRTGYKLRRLSAESAEHAFKRAIGRYALYGEIASGGMATVHFGRLLGPVGFSRTVAIKTLHPQFAKDPDFVAMFLDEARLAARIRHPNVVPTLDVVSTDDELVLVMDYVQGESLARLIRTSRRQGVTIPPRIATAVLAGVLQGLHAAHEAKNERAEPLGLVHRDVSPHNVLVGTDGVPRVLDFGVAKAAGRVQTTRDGQLKGKLAYMAPEQVRGGTVDRRTDVYAASIVLWEALTCRRLFDGDDDAQVFGKVLEAVVPAPSAVVPTIPKALDAIVLRGLDRDPEKRFQTAKEMAVALEKTILFATTSSIGEWVEKTAGDVLAKRADLVAEMESHSDISVDQLVLTAQTKAASRASQSELVVESLDALAPDSDPLDDALTIASDPSKSSPMMFSSATKPDGGISSSQLSSIAVATPGAAPATGQAGFWLKIAIAVTAGALIASLIALIAVTMSKRPDATQAAAGPQASAAQAGPATTSAPAPSAAAVAPSPSVSVTGIAIPAPTAEPTPTAKPKPAHYAAAAPHPAPHAAPQPVSKPAPAAPAPAPAARPDCNPPFTIDSSGIKHFKPQCL